MCFDNIGLKYQFLIHYIQLQNSVPVTDDLSSGFACESNIWAVGELVADEARPTNIGTEDKTHDGISGDVREPNLGEGRLGGNDGRGTAAVDMERALAAAVLTKRSKYKV